LGISTHCHHGQARTVKTNSSFRLFHFYLGFENKTGEERDLAAFEGKSVDSYINKKILSRSQN